MQGFQAGLCFSRTDDMECQIRNVSRCLLFSRGRGILAPQGGTVNLLGLGPTQLGQSYQGPQIQPRVQQPLQQFPGFGQQGFGQRNTVQPSNLPVSPAFTRAPQAPPCGNPNCNDSGCLGGCRNSQPKKRHFIPQTDGRDSVGQIIEVGGMHHKAFNKVVGPNARKFDGQYAWGRTGLKPIVLTRGTPTPVDDIQLLKGQTFLSLSSESPGTTYLTGVAPNAEGWDRRRSSTRIHWVDGNWAIPTPISATAGTVSPAA